MDCRQPESSASNRDNREQTRPNPWDSPLGEAPNPPPSSGDGSSLADQLLDVHGLRRSWFAICPPLRRRDRHFVSEYPFPTKSREPMRSVWRPSPHPSPASALESLGLRLLAVTNRAQRSQVRSIITAAERSSQDVIHGGRLGTARTARRLLGQNPSTKRGPTRSHRGAGLARPLGQPVLGAATLSRLTQVETARSETGAPRGHQMTLPLSAAR
jgi:hypothetical protein